MALNVIELTGERGGRIGLSTEQGEGEKMFILSGTDHQTAPTPDEVNDFANTLIGGVNNLQARYSYVGETNAGKIDRVLPRIHEFRSELSVAAVNLQPFTDKHEEAESYYIYGQAYTKTQWPNPKKWLAQVKYIRRPYFMLHNDEIPTLTKTYWPSDGGSGIPVTVCQEWRRFTTTKFVPLGDTVNASSSDSAMFFRTQSGSDPNERNFTGKIFASLELYVMELDWYMVPYRYLFNPKNDYHSYLTRFINRLNQTEFMGFPKGSLMYLGAEPIGLPFIPIYPKQKKINSLVSTGFYQDLLCNLKLKFAFTTRKGSDVPNDSNTLYTANKNRVLAGHNLFPNFGSIGTFNYATSEPASASDADRNPAFKSFEFDLFFTDPLLVQTGGSITE